MGGRRVRSDRIHDIVKRVVAKLEEPVEYDPTTNRVDEVMELEGFRFIIKEQEWNMLPEPLRKSIMKAFDAWSFNELYDKVTAWETFEGGSHGCEGIWVKRTKEAVIALIPCMVYYKMNRTIVLDHIGVYVYRFGV